MTMTPLDLLLIGNESLTRECGEIARARGHRIAAVVTRHAGTAAWAREAGSRSTRRRPCGTDRSTGRRSTGC